MTSDNLFRFTTTITYRDKPNEDDCKFVKHDFYVNSIDQSALTTVAKVHNHSEQHLAKGTTDLYVYHDKLFIKIVPEYNNTLADQLGIMIHEINFDLGFNEITTEYDDKTLNKILCTLGKRAELVQKILYNSAIITNDQLYVTISKPYYVVLPYTNTKDVIEGIIVTAQYSQISNGEGIIKTFPVDQKEKAFAYGIAQVKQHHLLDATNALTKHNAKADIEVLDKKAYDNIKYPNCNMWLADDYILGQAIDENNQDDDLPF